MKYFEGCTTIEEVKTRFRDLAKRLHPDAGGDAAEFRDMMDEYQIAFERYKTVHRAMDGKTYEKATTETADQFADIINGMMGFDGITVEIIGSWVWVSGNTYPYREQIKALGFFWSKSKHAWYYTGESEKSHRRGHYSMDGLRNHWGSTVVDTDSQRKIG